MAGHDPGDEPLPSKSTGRSGRIQLAVFLLLTAGVLWLVWLDSIPENVNGLIRLALWLVAAIVVVINLFTMTYWWVDTSALHGRRPWRFVAGLTILAVVVLLALSTPWTQQLRFELHITEFEHVATQVMEADDAELESLQQNLLPSVGYPVHSIDRYPIGVFFHVSTNPNAYGDEHGLMYVPDPSLIDSPPGYGLTIDPFVDHWYRASR